MRSLPPIAVLLLIGICIRPARAQQAALFDELVPLFPDTSPRRGTTALSSDTPRGVPAGVHALLAGLPGGATVQGELKQPTKGLDARLYRLIDVPVEQNTGLRGRTEAWDKKENPHVIREAPFRVFEVLRPVKGALKASEAGVLALRAEVAVPPDAEPGPRTLELVLKTGSWEAALRWELTVHPVTVPSLSSQHFGYTNWFSPRIIAQRHDLRRWSEPFWKMLGRYADLMARGRQNTFWIRWGDFGSLSEEDAVSIDRRRLERYIRLFLRRGFTRIEGGHLAHRHKGDWNSPRLDLAFTGSDVTSEQGRVELAALLAEVRVALDAVDLPEKALYLQHLTDEPTDTNAESYKALAAEVRKHMPGVKIFDATMSLKLVGAVDHWCPQIQVYQHRREFFEQRRESGDAVWVYTCLFPGGPWLNRLLDQERLRPTYLGWALAKYDLEGFLHWGLNHYRSGVNPFEQSVVPHGGGPPNFLPAGDSHVVYPGEEGPLSGQRFEAQRIGMEDAELLRLLRVRSPEKAESIIARVFRAFDDFEKDVTAYRAARAELLRALSPSSVPERLPARTEPRP